MTFAAVAPALHRAGLNVLPVRPHSKRPPEDLRWRWWQKTPQNPRAIARLVERYPAHGVALLLRDGLVHLDADRPEALQRLRDLPSAWAHPTSETHPGGGGALVRCPGVRARNFLAPDWLEIRAKGYTILPTHDGRRSLHGLGTVELVQGAPTLTVDDLAGRVDVDVSVFSEEVTPARSLLSSYALLSSLEPSSLELSSERDGVSLARFAEPAVLRHVATVLRLPTVEFRRDFPCVLHHEARPSAALLLGDNGVPVYCDQHGPSKGAPLILTLPEVRAAQVSGVVRQIRGPELATWALRLLVEAGVMQPVEVNLPPLPSWVAEPIQRTYDGFRLLLGCRWLHTYGAPAPFTWDFAAAWCGLPRKDVGAAILHLRHEGRLRLVGRHQRANLFLPGEGLRDDTLSLRTVRNGGQAMGDD